MSYGDDHVDHQGIITRYKHIKLLNKSTFAHIYYAYDTLTEKEVVLKTFYPIDGNREIYENERNVLIFIKEREGVQKYVDSFSCDSKLIFPDMRDTNICYVIVSEYCKGKDVFDHHQSFDLQSYARKLLADVEPVLNKLHSLGVRHRDIKPENIMYDPEKNTFTLIDFGLSYIQESGKQPIALFTSGYRPKKVTREHQYGFFDFYALAITLYEICHGKIFPFSKETGEYLGWKFTDCTEIKNYVENIFSHI